MKDNYLWDRTGEPDPELIRLEEFLGQFKLRQTSHPAEINQAVAVRNHEAIWWWAAAAVLVLGTITVIFAERKQLYAPATMWRLSLAGSKSSAVHAGQLIETGASDLATLESERVGRVEISPDSRVRVLSIRSQRQQFALDRGTIHALIWAPPARFAVDTPWAKAIDLGCQYTLHVGASGNGLLTVQTGWVAFQWHTFESFIPAGAACATRAQNGPGTPYFVDAPTGFAQGLERFDTGDLTALKTILSKARARDALTLWHLLRRTQGRDRARVFDRLSTLVPLPPEAKRAAILAGKTAAMDAVWNALQLGDTDWWREWKRQW
jgi:hypothetical protein